MGDVGEHIFVAVFCLSKDLALKDRERERERKMEEEAEDIEEKMGGRKRDEKYPRRNIPTSVMPQ